MAGTPLQNCQQEALLCPITMQPDRQTDRQACWQGALIMIVGQPFPGCGPAFQPVQAATMLPALFPGHPLVDQAGR